MLLYASGCILLLPGTVAISMKISEATPVRAIHIQTIIPPPLYFKVEGGGLMASSF